MNRAARILIVGAGPTGMTAAVELSRHGFSPVVVERHAEPSNLSRAVGIMPSSMRIFDRTSAGGRIRAEAVALKHVVVHRRAKAVARLRLDLLPDENARILGLAQDRTEGILRDTFAEFGGAVRFGSQVSALSSDETGATATINGAAEKFDYVIAADGIGSVCRTSLGLDYRGFDLPETWSIADVDSSGWPGAGEFRAFLLADGHAAIVVPLEAQRFRVIASHPDALAALPVPMVVDHVHRTAQFTISVRQIERYSKGCVYFAGDAAHCHSPVGGRGMNLGIADAADLARRFADGGLEGYHAARHRIGAETIALSERGRGIVMSKNGLRRGAAYAALWLASRVPAINRAFARTVLQD